LINPLITTINPLISLINPLIATIDPLIRAINPLISRAAGASGGKFQRLGWLARALAVGCYRTDAAWSPICALLNRQA